jgi:5'(3')-deoxyribonucleotidase
LRRRLPPSADRKEPGGGAGRIAIALDRFVLGVDLDGVCADFFGGLREIAAEWLEVPLDTLPEDVSFGLEEWNLDPAGGYQALHRFAVTQRDLFAQLRPIRGASVVLRRLSNRDVRIRIITHRLFIKYFHETAIRQTIEWLDRYDIPYWDLCFMGEKAAVGADLYIEDSPENVARLRAGGHDTIVFTNSTNRGIGPPRADTWDVVEELVLERLRARG